VGRGLLVRRPRLAAPVPNRMLLFPLAFVVGVSLGLLRGGRFQALSALRLRVTGLVVLAVIVQFGLGGVSSEAWRYVALVASYGLMGIWLAINLRDGPNWRRGGLALVALGYALNLLAILPNGNMPVSTDALRRAGGSQASFEEKPNIDKHVASGAGDVWPWLGDVIAVPPLRAVISIGDVAMLIGVVVVVYGGMTAAEPQLPQGRVREDDTVEQEVA